MDVDGMSLERIRVGVGADGSSSEVPCRWMCKGAKYGEVEE
jgi:hypothetical protein